MKTLKIKAFRRIVKMREFCATADGEKTMVQIFKIWTGFMATIASAFIIDFFIH